MSYIKLDRDIQNWEWYTDGNTMRVFIDLLINASYEDRMWKGKELRRGQLPTSSAAIATRTGLTDRQVTTALSHLKEAGTITTRAAGHCSVITIVNYSAYQDAGKGGDEPGSAPPVKYHYPTADEINAYASSIGKVMDAAKFISYYSDRHWLFHDGTPLNWKAAVKAWKTEFSAQPEQTPPTQPDEELDDWGKPITKAGESSAIFVQ